MKMISTTDANGVAECLGIQAETKVELEEIMAYLKSRPSRDTLFTFNLSEEHSR